MQVLLSSNGSTALDEVLQAAAGGVPVALQRGGVCQPSVASTYELISRAAQGSSRGTSQSSSRQSIAIERQQRGHVCGGAPLSLTLQCEDLY